MMMKNKNSYSLWYAFNEPNEPENSNGWIWLLIYIFFYIFFETVRAVCHEKYEITECKEPREKKKMLKYV